MWDEYWELNWGPLQEQQVPLTTEPSTWPLRVGSLPTRPCYGFEKPRQRKVSLCWTKATVWSRGQLAFLQHFWCWLKASRGIRFCENLPRGTPPWLASGLGSHIPHDVQGRSLRLCHLAEVSKIKTWYPFLPSTLSLLLAIAQRVPRVHVSPQMGAFLQYVGPSISVVEKGSIPLTHCIAGNRTDQAGLFLAKANFRIGSLCTCRPEPICMNVPSSAEKRISKEEKQWASVRDNQEAPVVPVQGPEWRFHPTWNYCYVNVQITTTYFMRMRLLMSQEPNTNYIIYVSSVFTTTPLGQSYELSSHRREN